MPEVLGWIYKRLQPLLEDLRFGEAAIAFAFPDEGAVNQNGKMSRLGTDQADFADSVTIGGEDFLRHPTGPQPPAAGGAKVNFDNGGRRGGVSVHSK